MQSRSSCSNINGPTQDLSVLGTHQTTTSHPHSPLTVVDWAYHVQRGIALFVLHVHVAPRTDVGFDGGDVACPRPGAGEHASDGREFTTEDQHGSFLSLEQAHASCAVTL